MPPMPERGRGLRLAIAALCALLVAANVTGWLAFRAANLGASWGEAIWGYLDSGAFQVITASVMLPILLALVDELFDVRGAVEERRAKREQEVEERRSACVQGGHAEWHSPYEITTAVCLARPDDPPEQLRQLETSLRNLVNRGNRLANEWRHTLPTLGDRHREPILRVFNIQRRASMAVAHVVANKPDASEVAALQDALRVIQAHFNDVAFHRISDILEGAANLASGNLTEAETEQARRAMDQDAASLAKFVANALDHQARHDTLWPHLRGTARPFGQAAQAVRQWSIEHPDEPVQNSPLFRTFEEAYGRAATADLLHARHVPHSHDYLLHLARAIAFDESVEIVQVSRMA